jgi:hypothetical protein
MGGLRSRRGLQRRVRVAWQWYECVEEDEGIKMSYW